MKYEVHVRIWDGEKWSPRNGDQTHHCFSDGSFDSVFDPYAPEPDDVRDGDLWSRALEPGISVHH